MTDDAMKDLVSKHDSTITQLVTSVEHLVKSQTETNKRLEEISKFLAKQAIFASKLDDMDSNLRESFERVHKRISEVDAIQKSEAGCNSVKLLSKDVEALGKESIRLVGQEEEHRITIEQLKEHQSSYPSKMAIITVSLFLIGYLITWGTYVNSTINYLDKRTEKVTTLLEEEMKDTQKLLKVIYHKKETNYEK